mmetsp:Transcript_142408/g.262472  ORF Transcript_142408/g.262472 Transcript_142408/m.262472 type:complete len:647 (-) Transcript_142408:206-2146(-)
MKPAAAFPVLKLFLFFTTSCGLSECGEDSDVVSLIQKPLRPLKTQESHEVEGATRASSLSAGRESVPLSSQDEESKGVTSEAVAHEGDALRPCLFFATHHKSGTVLARKLGDALMKVVADESWGPLLVRGIDWNETGTPGELMNPPCKYHGCKQFAQEPCPPANHKGPTLGIFQNIDLPTLKRIDAGCSNFRMVHFIRDPVALTVSAYLYHSRVENDTAEPGRLNREPPHKRLSPARIGPKVYKEHSFKDGLEMEAKLELNTTLQMMREVNDATFWRTNVLTVALESFKADFDERARKIFGFLLGDRLPVEKLVLLQRFAHDIGANADSVHWAGHEHITPKEDTARAFEEWNAYHDEDMFRRVQAVRESLGYNDDGQPSWISSNSATGSQIPRLLHQSWKNSLVPSSLTIYAATWRVMHPKWTFRFWSDHDNERLWQVEAPNMLDMYRSFRTGVMRADATRLLYMLRHGGVYADFDVEPCQNLDQLLKRWQVVLVRSPKGFVSNYFIASLPGHPFWKFALQQLQYVDQRVARERSRLEKNGGIFTAGDETMWTAGPRFLDETLKKFIEVSSSSVMNKVKVYDFTDWQAEVGIHHWTGTWHCPGGGNDCAKGLKHAAKPTDGAEHGVNASNRCSAVPQHARPLGYLY